MKDLKLIPSTLMTSLILFLGLSFSWTASAGLAEFGAISTNEPGKTVFAVSDGSTFARYCLIELTVKDKKIHWISHPLEADYVKREPTFIYNFDKDHLVIATKGRDNKKKSVAEVHLYNKPNQTLSLLAQAACEFPKSITIKKNNVHFACDKKKKKGQNTVKIKDNEEGKTFAQLLGNKTLVHKKKSLEAKHKDWVFQILETDNYFKDRLQLVKSNEVLKEFKAENFKRCFDYKTLEGSQKKFNSEP